MQKIKSVLDLSCDLGEGMPHDSILMPLLGNCSIACGGHFGDEASIKAALELAQEYGVKVGAHPSYPDVENFGRAIKIMGREELHHSLLEQIYLFEKLCKETGMTMHHIKLHGALYNQAARNPETAEIIVALVKNSFPGVYLFCPPHSVVAHIAVSTGLQIKREIFADRNYNNDLTLVQRGHPRAVISDPEEALEHVKGMVINNVVKSICGVLKPIKADTICVHGDNPAAFWILKKLSDYLQK